VARLKAATFPVLKTKQPSSRVERRWVFRGHNRAALVAINGQVC
jgi:hypothetical protein